MAIEEEVVPDTYLGDDSTDVYDYSPRILAAAELKVVERDADGVDHILVLGDDYEVDEDTIGNEDGGSITLLAGNLAEGHTLTITRVVPFTQPFVFKNQRAFHGATVEKALDRIVLMAQQLKEMYDRAVKLPESEVGTDALTRLPSFDERVGRFLKCNAEGEIIGVEAVDVGETVASPLAAALLELTTAGAWLTALGATAFGQSLLAAANAAAARTLLELTLLENQPAAFSVVSIAGTNPTELSGDVNDWTPAVSGFIRITSDSPRNVTGMGNEVNGRRVVLRNAGSYPITLRHEDVSSAAAKRFSFRSGADIVLLPGDSIPLTYDAGLSRWVTVWRELMRVEESTDIRSGFVDYTDFVISNNATAAAEYDGWFFSAAGTSGSASMASGAEAGHPGVVELTTGVDTDGEVSLFRGSNAERLADGSIQLEAIMKIPTIADGTDDFDLYFGIFNVSTSKPQDGVYFQYDRDASVNWLFTAAAAGVFTETAGTVVHNGWTRLKILINAAGTSAGFYVDGILIATVSTNLPSAANLSYGFCIRKEAGTTARTLRVDAVAIRKTLTTKR